MNSARGRARILIVIVLSLFWLIVLGIFAVAMVVIFVPEWVSPKQGGRLSNFAFAGLASGPLGRLALGAYLLFIVVLLLRAGFRKARRRRH